MKEVTSLDIKQKARSLGFDLCGIAPAGDLPELAFFQTWLARGYAGEMAYLHRTAADIESLLPLGSAIRLVKGAYLEPPAIAFPNKRDVDEQFFDLACRMLEAQRSAGGLLHIATHDATLVERLRTVIASRGVPRSAYEFAMLYGIQRPLQTRLVTAGEPLSVLIAYGTHWFPWYMRRLAERPANVGFVVKNLLAR